MKLPIMKTQINHSGKIITVAKDADAMIALDYATAQPEQLWEYEIPNSEYDLLLTSTIIDQINKICNSMIDDYEDEMIKDLSKLNAALLYLQNEERSPETENILRILVDMFLKAINSKTAIYFYF